MHARRTAHVALIGSLCCIHTGQARHQASESDREHCQQSTSLLTHGATHVMGASSSSCVPSTVAPSSTLNVRFDRSHSDAVVSRIPFGTSTVPPVGRSPQSSIARCVHCVGQRGNHKGHRACAQQWWRRSTVLKLSAVCANRERHGASAQLFCESSDVCIGRKASRHGAHNSACRTAVVFATRVHRQTEDGHPEHHHACRSVTQFTLHERAQQAQRDQCHQCVFTHLQCSSPIASVDGVVGSLRHVAHLSNLHANEMCAWV
jgi:hypothetical protein